jgi:hypothetical protein
METLAMKNRNRFAEIRRQIDSRSIRAFARTLPWPYNGMVNDVLGSLQTGGNYLAALGLASYTEICGRQIFFDGDNDKEDWKCFNKFIEHMGSGEILNKNLIFDGHPIKFKDAVRNGLVHRYFMKVGSGAVAMWSTKDEAQRTGFIMKNQNEVIMVVIPYFILFCNAVKKARDQGLLKWK